MMMIPARRRVKGGVEGGGQSHNSTSDPDQGDGRPEGPVGLPGGKRGHDGLVPEDDDGENHGDNNHDDNDDDECDDRDNCVDFDHDHDQESDDHDNDDDRDDYDHYDDDKITSPRSWQAG